MRYFDFKYIFNTPYIHHTFSISLASHMARDNNNCYSNILIILMNFFEILNYFFYSILKLKFVFHVKVMQHVALI